MVQNRLWAAQTLPYLRVGWQKFRELSVGIAAGPRKGWSLSRQGEAGSEASVPVLCGSGFRMGMGRPLCSASRGGLPVIRFTQSWAGNSDIKLPTWPPQLLQTTNNSPMNSKPQQIKMQSTKKGPLSKREEGGPSGMPAAGGPSAGEDASSLGATQAATSSGLQPQVSRAS